MNNLKKNKEQEEAIGFGDGPMLVLGTPGSGKTTVIVNRVKNLINKYKIKPEYILVITFTTAAAVSMKERYKKLMNKSECKVRMCTFHSFFYWIIRTAFPGRKISVLNENLRKQIIKGILKQIDAESYDNEETLLSVIRQIDEVSADLIDIENYYSSDISNEHFRKLYKLFNEEKEKK